MIHTVKGFDIVNKAEIDVFLELSCFFHDPADVGIQCLKQAQKEMYSLYPFFVLSETEPFEIAFAIIINITNYKKLILHNTLEIPHMLICMYSSFLW